MTSNDGCWNCINARECEHPFGCEEEWKERYTDAKVLRLFNNISYEMQTGIIDLMQCTQKKDGK